VSFATPPDPAVYTSVVSVSDILTSIDGQYDVARSFDINGGHTYDPVVPDFINTLDYMGPGYGYQIKMSSDGMLDWSASGIFGSSAANNESKPVSYPASPGVSHFSPVAQTTTWMDLWGTFTIDGISVELGDEVGVFVNDDCFGAYTVDTSGYYGFLPVYGDDSVTPEKDGADPGDLLTIKIWDSSAGVEYTLSTDEYTGPDPLTWTNGTTERVNIAAILGVIGECESDFDCDEDVDAADLVIFLNDFGRNQYSNPCVTENPCLGDLDCDRDVDSSDVTNFLEDFGRNQYSNPCPACSPQPPCEIM